MEEKDWFLKIREDIALMDFRSTSHNNDLLNLIYDYAWGFDEVNLCESYDHIINMGLSNNDTLSSIISFINSIDSKKAICLKEIIKDIISTMKTNYELQEDYFINTINYILVHERIITGVEDIEDAITCYEDSFLNSYKTVKKNNKQIKKILRQERGDNLE